MPDVPTALPDKVAVRALIRARGYTVTEIALKIGRPAATIYAITGRRKARPTGLGILRQLADALSTPRRPVRLSDICNWTGDDDIGSGAETKIPA